MNKIALSGNPRTDIGGKYAAQLRRNKQVPCVLYGGNNPVHFSVDEAALGKLIFTPDLNGVELSIGGATTLAMIHEKQFHPLTDRVIHVDFLELDEKKEATATMSVRLKGQPIGVRSGGMLSQPMRKLRVRGVPTKFPTHLEIDVADLGLNSSILVKDLKFDGLQLIDRADDVVVTVKLPKKVEEVVAATPGAPAAVGAAAPAADAKKAEAKPAAKK